MLGSREIYRYVVAQTDDALPVPCIPVQESWFSFSAQVNKVFQLSEVTLFVPGPSSKDRTLTCPSTADQKYTVWAEYPFEMSPYPIAVCRRNSKWID